MTTQPILPLRNLVRFVLLTCAALLFGAPFARAAVPTIYAFNMSGSRTINQSSAEQSASSTLALGIRVSAQVTLLP